MWTAGRPQPPGSPGLAGGRPLEGGSPKHERTPDLSTEQLLSGSFSTEELVAAAKVLRTAGWSEERIRRQVYAPFIVVGPASWSDSWHAPRYGPGSLIRQHEGQDVLCRYGTEVLAPEDGTIEFGTGLLGGRSAHLFREDGGYYYFAHFVRWNDREFSDGDQVHRGDVIGYCGDTGNATVAHVHFGWYGPDGVAIDPMRRLISWLREAEADLPALLEGKDLAAASALGVEEDSLDIVRALLDDPLPEDSLTAWRNTSATVPRGALELTPVLVFLVLFGMSGRRTAPGSRRRRPSGGHPSGSSTSRWGERRGPLLS
ncbi:MAG TPA: M23 family metallopeptidase [Actinomycetota bacterium]|nr:M23 family metallopeptidase [Actinomycetota bacterium]